MKKIVAKEEYFEIPSSKKYTNLYQFNKPLNISLNLLQPLEKQKNTLKAEEKKKNLIQNGNNLLILPLNEDNPFTVNEDNNDIDEKSNNNDEFFNVNPELKKLKEEYDSSKEEYNKIKCYLDNNTSIDKHELKEKEKLKKKIKKRLKQIKDMFREKSHS